MTCWRFPVIVIQDTADTSGDVVFPDFPGCISSGVSVEAATNAAAEALSLHLQDMIAAGEAIPRPSTYNDIPEGLITAQSRSLRTSRLRRVYQRQSIGARLGRGSPAVYASLPVSIADGAETYPTW